MPNTHDAQKARNSSVQIGEALDTALEDAPLFAAYLYEHKVQCGRPTCKCATTSFRHPMWCVSFTEDGQSRTRVVPLEQVSAIREMTDAYRRFRRARSQLRTRCEELLAAVDAFGERQCRRGRTRYDKLNPTRRRGRKAPRKSSVSSKPKRK